MDGTEVELVQLTTSRSLKSGTTVKDLRIDLPRPSPSTSTSRSTSDPIDLYAEFARIQFRQSTLGNGRPDARRQLYVLRVVLEAVREDGEGVEVGRWESEGTVVRGRSPGNFVKGVKRKKGREVDGEWGVRRGKRKRMKRKVEEDQDEEDD